jgi:hypothetical protein
MQQNRQLQGGEEMGRKSVYLLCVAHGGGQEWEAFSLDFDLAVQGNSFEEVKGSLETAIRNYVEAAMAQPEPARTQLLNRRVPLRTKLLWWWRIARWAFFDRRPTKESTVGFPVPCPA